MLDVLGVRQRSLLELLLKNKGGMTVDELSRGLEITRNAVRQHLAALEADGLVTQGATRPSRGRPEQLFVLADKGREMFPRHYSWLARLMLESIKRESGDSGVSERMDAMGRLVGEQLRQQHPTPEDPGQKVEKLAEIMHQLGYDAHAAVAEDEAPVIEADNCVFHALAMTDPEVCRFDLAVLSTFTGSPVEHQECMAKGGNTCRFRFRSKG